MRSDAEKPGSCRNVTEARPSSHACNARLTRWVAARLAEVQLPPADVPPRACLPADAPVHADRLEAHRLVQPDARLVREGDACDEQSEAGGAQALEELRVKRSADAGALCARIDVGAHLRR